MSATPQRIQRLLAGHAVARAFLAESEGVLGEPERPGFRAVYARAARRLGVAASELLDLTELPEGARRHWTLLDWTRAALLLSALERVTPERRPALVLSLLEGAELGEQESLLRTLCLLPEPSTFLETGLTACRTNALRVFQAIACENAFPAAFFPEPAFNQMVLKAIFLEIPVRRIEALQARVTGELTRMALAHASERRAAGRSVPADVELIVRARTPDPGNAP